MIVAGSAQYCMYDQLCLFVSKSYLIAYNALDLKTVSLDNKNQVVSYAIVYITSAHAP